MSRMRGRCAHNICARLAGGRVGLQLTAFSFGGTAFSHGSGACHTSARPGVRGQPWHLASHSPRPLQRECTCSPLTAAFRSSVCCRAPQARPRSSPPSPPSSPLLFPSRPARCFTVWCPHERHCCCSRCLRGDLELRGGYQGSCCGAARCGYVRTAIAARARVFGSSSGAVPSSSKRLHAPPAAAEK